jgi:HEAT repeat protein
MAARSALGMLKGRAVDEAIVTLLGQKVTDGVTGELLLAVADRRVFPAKGVVAASLMSASLGVRVQALSALRAIGTPSDIPAVLDLLLKTADEAERREAEKTVAALAQTMASANGRSRAVKARLATENDPAARVRLIGLLPLLGDSNSLPVIRTALKDTRADVFDAAVRAIVSWPTSAALDDIRQLARDSRNETHRLLAIRGFVRSIGLETYRNPEAAVADLTLAAGFAWRPEEYTLILGALASFPCRDALDVATGFLREPSVKAEAQAAVDGITKSLSKDATR